MTMEKEHAYRAPGANDSRTVCPALNSMANHGYIPHSGKSVTPCTLYRGLRKCYRLSAPLALVLVLGGYILAYPLTFLCRLLAPLALHDLGRRRPSIWGVEHDASVVHRNADADARTGTRDGAAMDGYSACAASAYPAFAPVAVVPAWVADFAADAQGFGALLTPQILARTRVRREATLVRPLDAVHAEIARGEFAIIMHVWRRGRGGGEAGAPMEWVVRWLAEERLPEEWVAYVDRPGKGEETALRDVMRLSKAIRAEMLRLREKSGE